MKGDGSGGVFNGGSDQHGKGLGPVHGTPIDYPDVDWNPVRLDARELNRPSVPQGNRHNRQLENLDLGQPEDKGGRKR